MSVRPAYPPTDSKFHASEHAQTRFAERYPQMCDGLHAPAIVRRMLDLIEQYDEAGGEIQLSTAVRTNLGLAHGELAHEPRPEGLCYITDPQTLPFVAPNADGTPRTVPAEKNTPVFVSKDNTIVTVLTPADFNVLRARAEKATRTIRRAPATPTAPHAGNGTDTAPTTDTGLRIVGIPPQTLVQIRMLADYTGEKPDDVIDRLITTQLSRIERKHPEIFRPRPALADLLGDTE